MAINQTDLTSEKRRSVITGMGVIVPNGQDLDIFWNSIHRGISAAGPVTRFDVAQMPSQIAAEVKGFDCQRFMDAKMARRCVLSTQYAIAASSLAIRDSRLALTTIDPDRIGIVEGTTVSGMESVLRGYDAYNTKGINSIKPFDVINGYCGEGSSQVAIALGIQGHAITYCSGCASGNDAIGYAMLMIRQDEADVMIAGATDDMMIEPMYGGLCSIKVMSRRNSEPAQAMRPFDRERDGFVLGEGAAFLVLEELSHALLRGAKIYAEVLGHGRSCEAYHPTNTHPDGIGFRRAMEKALRRARVSPSEVDYINAHGTATSTNDPIETLAIKSVFNERAGQLAISSTKPITGHLMGAAGAVETVVCALAIKHAMIPATINLNVPAEGCDLDYVPRKSRPYPVRIALNLNAGFGGKTACLVLGNYPSTWP
jgi:3-oxoacyl-[acyl-carrier-protein] synthase II